jgi:cell division FtsZ-interacting protein ZapD
MSNVDVANIAGRILDAYRRERQGDLRKADLQKELDRARKLIRTIRPHTSLEQERLEVLEGAVDSLESAVSEQAWAAMYLLEQLSSVPARPSTGEVFEHKRPV